jgi:NitT/TauT family transport system substrate-binding protein
MRLSLSPGYISHLATYLAIERGYFAAEGIDLQVIRFTGATLTQTPLLARGDIEITPMTPNPALFNQFAQGFNVKVVASINEEHAGYTSATVLMVRKDLYDSGAIRKPSDLRGKHVDGVGAGGPCDLFARSTIASAGLRLSDLDYTTKLTGQANQLAGMRNGAVDVSCALEPTGSQMEAAGYAVRWLRQSDVTPWYQDAYWAVNGDFLRAHRRTVEGFLVAYLRGVADVAKAHGNWSPDLVAVMTKWSGLPPEVITRLGRVPYFEEYGAINLESMRRTQAFWAALGLIPKPVPIDQIVDGGLIGPAQRDAGIH